MKSISGALKLYLASYKEVKLFSAFSSDLDFATVIILNRGAKITELLKQKNFNPLTVEEQFVLLFAGLSGLLDNIETNKIKLLESFILEEFNKFEFFNEDANIGVIHTELTESLLDVINS